MEAAYKAALEGERAKEEELERQKAKGAACEQVGRPDPKNPFDESLGASNIKKHLEEKRKEVPKERDMAGTQKAVDMFGICSNGDEHRAENNQS